MATTTNYSWTTPDDTALVKDGASAIRSLGTSIDTTTKALNPSTTLGDIEYRSSTANTNTRLGIGTTGQVLTVAGGVPSWATASSGGFTLINAGGTTLSGTTTTISSIPGTYKHLYGYIEAAYFSANDSDIYLRFNSDTGSNYLVSEIYGAGSGYSTSTVFNTATNTYMYRVTGGGTGTAYNEKAYGSFNIPLYADASIHHVEMRGRGKTTASTYYHQYSQGVWNSASAITSVSIVSNNTMSGGKIYLYGVS